MEIGRQIKKYRTEQKLSQEELAEQVFVTRQTVSNWENEKNYPDIKSLLLLSQLFSVSLDQLVMGDYEEMKQAIQKEDIQQLNRDSWIYAILLLASILTIAPLYIFLELAGLAIWAVIYGAAMVYALRLEKQKKKHDIHTYREIIAFTEGRQLDEAQKNQEVGKRPYQTVFYVLGAAGLTFLLVYGMCMIFGKLSM